MTFEEEKFVFQLHDQIRRYRFVAETLLSALRNRVQGHCGGRWCSPCRMASEVADNAASELAELRPASPQHDQQDSRGK